jgi:hypothetical protein
MTQVTPPSQVSPGCLLPPSPAQQSPSSILRMQLFYIGGYPFTWLAGWLAALAGNINQLVLKLSTYIEELHRHGGVIAEFVNPKYADASKTAFKSSTRLECMMQVGTGCSHFLLDGLLTLFNGRAAHTF